MARSERVWIRKLKLDGFVDSLISSCFVHIRKPGANIFRLALDSRATVRVIRTDEDLMIVQSVSRILNTDTVNKGLIHENQHTHA